MRDLVAVAAYLLPPEAYILRGRLEAEGIYAAVTDENMVTNAPWVTGCGMRVLVRQEDFARAFRIRRECERAGASTGSVSDGQAD